jgi:SpoVK/Ycf46/Vps4 family AAA+-type ATPase
MKGYYHATALCQLYLSKVSICVDPHFPSATFANKCSGRMHACLGCRYVEVAEAEGEAAADEKVELIVTEEDLRLARKNIRPSALKEVQCEVPKVYHIHCFTTSSYFKMS